MNQELFSNCLFLLTLTAALLITGVMWFVQIVHYPLMKYIARDRAVRFFAKHQKRTSLVVFPLMIAELGTMIALLFLLPDEEVAPYIYLSAVFLLFGWISTFLLQLPCHFKLRQGYDQRLMLFLIRTNWIRTSAWSLRSLSLLLAAAILIV